MAVKTTIAKLDAPARKLVGQPRWGRYPMAGKGVRGRCVTGSIQRPRAAFGSFRRDEKNSLAHTLSCKGTQRHEKSSKPLFYDLLQ